MTTVLRRDRRGTDTERHRGRSQEDGGGGRRAGSTHPSRFAHKHQGRRRDLGQVPAQGPERTRMVDSSVAESWPPPLLEDHLLWFQVAKGWRFAATSPGKESATSPWATVNIHTGCSTGTARVFTSNPSPATSVQPRPLPFSRGPGQRSGPGPSAGPLHLHAPKGNTAPSHTRQPISTFVMLPSWLGLS